MKGACLGSITERNKYKTQLNNISGRKALRETSYN